MDIINYVYSQWRFPRDELGFCFRDFWTRLWSNVRWYGLQFLYQIIGHFCLYKLDNLEGCSLAKLKPKCQHHLENTWVFHADIQRNRNAFKTVQLSFFFFAHHFEVCDTHPKVTAWSKDNVTKEKFSLGQVSNVKLKVFRFIHVDRTQVNHTFFVWRRENRYVFLVLGQMMSRKQQPCKIRKLKPAKKAY